ncbi:MAG: RDD family protein [Bryobacteraceae bacterium]|nr:RDD family protein [Bryobacteraceae bacterium]
MKKAEIGPRIGAVIIDAIIGIPLVLLSFIPFVGIFTGLLLAAYWLCRDLLRPSLGKKALGLEVVGMNGERATDQQLLMRNLPFIIAPLLSMIPFLGIVASPAVGLLVNVGELIMVITQGHRFGDQIAGTQVVAKS